MADCWYSNQFKKSSAKTRFKTDLPRSKMNRVRYFVCAVVSDCMMA